jgi:hypothetical protein
MRIYRRQFYRGAQQSGFLSVSRSRGDGNRTNFWNVVVLINLDYGQILIQSRVRVIIDEVLDWVLDLLTTWNTRLVITLNYSAIANLHTLLFTRTHGKSFPARSVITRRLLVTTSNNGYSYVSGLKSSLNGGSLPSRLFFESSRVESYVTTDGQTAPVSWNTAPIWGLRPDF